MSYYLSQTGLCLFGFLLAVGSTCASAQPLPASDEELPPSRMTPNPAPFSSLLDQDEPEKGSEPSVDDLFPLEQHGEEIQGPAPPAADRKPLPIPSREDQRNAHRELREVFAGEYAVAKTTEAKLKLSKRLVDEFNRSDGEPSIQYALLADAVRFAKEANDGQIAMQIANTTANRFAIDGLRAKISILSDMAGNARDPVAAKRLYTEAAFLFDEALSADRFDELKRASRMAVALSRRTDDRQVLIEAREQDREITAYDARFKAAELARTKLINNPKNAQAEHDLAIYYLFNQQNYETGLAHLSKSDMAAYRDIAIKDLDEPTEANTQTQVADAWWGLAERHKGVERLILRNRASFWYFRALPNLNGFAKTRIEKRLTELKNTRKSTARSRGRGWIDLLEMVRLPQHAIAGKWQRTPAGTVVTDGLASGSNGPILSLPYTPVRHYEFEVEFGYRFASPSSTTSDILVVFLPMQGASCLLAIDKQTSGISTINGKPYAANDATSKKTIPQVKKYRLRVQVRQRGEQVSIVTLLNDAPLIQWSGKRRALSVTPSWKLERLQTLGIGSVRGPLIIYSCHYRPYSGR